MSTPVTTARVAPKSYTPARHDRVISTGCDNGGPATAIESRITSIDKFVGPPNFQVAGQPAQGRSGGGLFTADGMLIGVCNCADPTDNEGLFAALSTIHSQLDESGLAMVYEQPATAGASVSLASASAATQPAVAAAAQPLGNMPREAADSMTAAPLGTSETASLDAAHGQTNEAEVICIVRPLADPQARSEVITLDRASSDFLRQLSAEKQAQSDRHLTSLEKRRGATAQAAAPAGTAARRPQPLSSEPGLALPTPLPTLR
jgi:hypothetical protein